jgi:hypothetical protein
MKHELEFYQKAGFKKVELTAGGNVGRYAWAMQGFDSKGPLPLETAKSNLRDAIYLKIPKSGEITREKLDAYRKQADDLAETCKTMSDVARFRFNGEKLGKQVMLTGSQWLGVFDLTKGSVSWRVFNVYYHEAMKKVKAAHAR